MCWGNREETIKGEEDETPQKIESLKTIKRDINKDYPNLDLSEDLIRTLFEEFKDEKGESLIKMIMISPMKNRAILPLDLSMVLTNLMSKSDILRDFFFLLNNFNEEEKDPTFLKYESINFKILVFHELDYFNFSDVFKKNISNSFTPIVILNLILTILFYSPIDNEKKGEILYELLNPDKDGFIKERNETVKIIFNYLTYLAIFLPDIYLNDFISKNHQELKKKNNNESNEKINYLNDIIKNFNEKMFDYKKKLIFLENSKNCKSDIINLYINYFLFYKHLNELKLSKNEFLEVLKDRNYTIFDPHIYRELLFTNLSKRRKYINYMNAFKTIIEEFEKKKNFRNKESVVKNILKENKVEEDLSKFFNNNLQVYQELYNSNEYTEKNENTNKKVKKKNKLFQSRELDEKIKNIKHKKIGNKKIEKTPTFNVEENKNEDDENINSKKKIDNIKNDNDNDDDNLLKGINEIINEKPNENINENLNENNNEINDENNNEINKDNLNENNNEINGENINENNNDDLNENNNEKLEEIKNEENNNIKNEENNNIKNEENNNIKKEENDIFINNNKINENNFENNDINKLKFPNNDNQKNKIPKKISERIQISDEENNNLKDKDKFISKSEIKTNPKKDEKIIQEDHNKSINLNEISGIKMEENNTIENDNSIHEKDELENPLTFKSNIQNENIINNDDTPRKNFPLKNKAKDSSPLKNPFNNLKEFKEDEDEKKNEKKNKSKDKKKKKNKNIINIEDELIDSSKPKLSIIKVLTPNKSSNKEILYNQNSNERKTLQLNTNTNMKSGEKSEHIGITDDEIFKLSQSNNKKDLQQLKMKQLQNIDINDIPKREDYYENEEEKHLKEMMNIQITDSNNNINFDKINTPTNLNNNNHPYLKVTSKVSSNTLLAKDYINGPPIIINNNVFKKRNDQLVNPNLFDLINSYKNDLNFIDINNPTIYLVYYFSHFNEYSQIEVDIVLKDIMSLHPSIIKTIEIKRFTPYFSSYNRDSVTNILNGSLNGDMINLYFIIMSYYNIFMRNSNLINIKATFIGTHFFNKLQECYFSDTYDNLMHLYKEDLFVDDNFIFDIEDYIVVIPIYTYKNIESPNEENKLFLAVFNCKNKNVTYLDSNDILNDNDTVMNNYTLIFKKFFKHLSEIKICKENISEWNYTADSIESICYDENLSNHIMTYYSKLICLNGKISTIEESNYTKIREELFKEISMLYIILGKFTKDEIENEKENILN